MSIPRGAAHKQDPISHSHALAGSVAGGALASLAEGLAAGLSLLGLGALLTSPFWPVIQGVILSKMRSGDLPLSKAISQAKAMAKLAAAIPGDAASVGSVLGSLQLFGGGATVGLVITGSPNIEVNDRPGVRASADNVRCDNHQIRPLAQGSETVLFNGHPAVRYGDAAKCGAPVKFAPPPAPPDVLIGGPRVTTEGPLLCLEPEIIAFGELPADVQAELRRIYGSALDYDQIRFILMPDEMAALGLRPFTLGNDILLPPDLFDQAMASNANELLVHELFHVLQGQSGMTTPEIIIDSLSNQFGPNGQGYDFTLGIEEGKSFSELNVEQQAQLISSAYGVGYFEPDCDPNAQLWATPASNKTSGPKVTLVPPGTPPPGAINVTPTLQQGVETFTEPWQGLPMV